MTMTLTNTSLRTRTTADGAGPAVLATARSWALYLLAAAVALTASGCLNEDASPDPFIGPSELGLALSLSASPDVLPTDGASQSLLTILARDGAGQAVPNLSLRLQLRFGGVLQDVGRISARTLVTGQNGTALATYTAPAAGAVDGGAAVEVLVTPVGDNFANAVPRTMTIRLVPTGTVVPPQDYTTGFRFSPDSPAEFQEVLFETACVAGTQNCVHDPSGQVVRYAWAFGDGATGAGPSVTHAYAGPGTFSVTLTVTDAFGRTASTIRTVTVASGGTPTAIFTFSPSSPSLGDRVFFNANASTAPTGRSIVSYAWTFGDGGSASGATVSHGFDVAGSYGVTLAVTDDRGAVGTTTNTVTVSTSLPAVSFVFSPSSPAIGAPVFFNASASRATVPGRTLVAYDWAFGDGSTGTGETTSHEYRFASTFTVSLTVVDNVGDRATTTASVTVGGSGASPTASFTVSPSPGTVDQDTVVDASASRAAPGETITRYDWDFGETGQRFQCPGDSRCGDQNRVFTYRYSRSGSFTINLTVTDSSGEVATTIQSLTVNSVSPPTASFTASPTTIGTGVPVFFDAAASTVSGGRTIVSYAWNFGDGSAVVTTPTPNTSHPFAAAGTYTVTLIVTDSAGDRSTVASVSITIT